MICLSEKLPAPNGWKEEDAEVAARRIQIRITRSPITPFRYLINVRWWANRLPDHIWTVDQWDMIPYDALMEIATDYDSKLWGCWNPAYEVAALAADDWQIFTPPDGAEDAYDPHVFWPHDIFESEEDNDD